MSFEMSEVILTAFYQIILTVESSTGTFIPLLTYKSGNQADFIYPPCQNRKALRARKTNAFLNENYTLSRLKS